MATEDKIQKSYHFFVEKENNKTAFTIQELAKAAGWSVVTARTYISKKWETLIEKKGEKFFVKGISKFSASEYKKWMSQSNKKSQDPYKPELEEDVERLVVKAKDCAVLALDIYNRPATIFKAEGFIVMMVIAWTSLLHAIFTKNGITHHYCNDDGSPQIIDGDTKCWELSKCVKEFFKSGNDPIRLNIEFMIGLRNKIEHRFAPKIDNHIGGECQAILLNFDECLTKEFGDYYALKELMVFPLQTSNLRNIGKVEVIKKFQGKHYDDIKEYIDAYRDNINDDVYNDPKFSFRVFLVPKTGNHKNSSDLSMEFVKYDANNPEERASQNQVVAMIKEKIIKTGNPEGMKAGKVVEKVSKKITKPFKIHHHTLAWKLYGARPAVFTKDHVTEYCYSDSVHSDFVYTPNWVDYLVRKLSNEEEYEKLLAFKPAPKSNK